MGSENKRIHLGSKSFCKDYNTEYAYMGGAMANAISSEEMIIALGKNGFIGSFGSGGLTPERVEKAILRIKSQLQNGPYCFNLLHTPGNRDLEKALVELYIKHNIRVIEAAAFITLSPEIVYYRINGLEKNGYNQIIAQNKIIAKISRKEVAEKFMQPAPSDIVEELLETGCISKEQAEMAKHIPMADDITVEGDSAGHTDNRPLISLLPSMIAIRDNLQKKYNYKNEIRIGAGGGISTPYSALGAFMMGADYVVTGSINQGCVESGSSEYVKKTLANVDMADVMMAPSADMFEQGGKVQVLKKGTMFPLNASKLYDLYLRYNSIDEIPQKDKERLEKMVFKKSFDDVWKDTEDFFMKRNYSILKKAQENPKKQMALIFRWYLAQSSRWAINGEESREMDYQIWCGQSMGAFNDWVKGTKYEKYKNRNVAEISKLIMEEASENFLKKAKQLITGLKNIYSDDC